MKGIIFTKEFKKAVKRAPKKLKVQLSERIDLFLSDQYSEQLSNHKLQGAYRDYRSINITGDFRVVFQEFETHYLFISLGTHSQLYE